MKKIRYFIILLLVGILVSCEGYLESVPFSTTSPENFYKTPKDAEIALTGVYHILTAGFVQGEGNQSTYSRLLMFMLNGGTDECVWDYRRSNAGYIDWGVAGFTSQNFFIDENWAFFYAGINRANYLIEKLPEIEGFSASRQIEIEAEAKLLRGFYHMLLSMMHGGIPVYNTSEQDPEASRESVEVVYQQIISDYEFAYANLPDRATIAGHVNKWTAAGLLAKAHTYLASMKMSGTPDFGLAINNFDWVDADDHYDKALTYTTASIGQSNYELIPEYRRLFLETTKDDQYKECLLTGEASTDASGYVINLLINGFIPQGNRDRVGGGYGWMRPSGELWLKYDANDMRRDNNCSGNYINTSPTEDIDGVLYHVPRTVPHADNGTICIGKYRMMAPTQKTYNKAFAATTLPLLRYADVLLLHAEAQYFTGDEAGARNTLNIVRQRSVGETASVDDLNTAYYKADFVEELLDERARELCFENWRRFDLARFNKYDEVINSMSPDYGFYNSIVTTLQQNWKPERIWIPLPLDQIDLNPNLIQNKGF